MSSSNAFSREDTKHLTAKIVEKCQSTFPKAKCSYPRCTCITIPMAEFRRPAEDFLNKLTVENEE